MRKIQVYGILAMLVVAVLIGFIAALDASKSWTFAVTSGGYILFGIKFLYDKWDKFYLFVQKAICVLFGKDTLWSITVKYESDDDNKIEKVKAAIKPLLCKEFKARNITSQIFEVRCEGLTVQVIDAGKNLEIHIFDMPTTYNRANDLITKTISPLFEGIENKLTINDKHYFLSVKFLEDNPFLGFYIRKIASRDLEKFDIHFTLDNNRVEICKDKIIVNTTSLTQLINVSKDVLGIAPH